MVHSVLGDGLIHPMSKDTESPARPVHSHKLLYLIKVKVDRGDMGEVSEVGGGCWEVVSKWGSLTAESELQNQRCPGGDVEMPQEDGMYRRRGNGKHG